jgi:hypothetical protein
LESWDEKNLFLLKTVGASGFWADGTKFPSPDGQDGSGRNRAQAFRRKANPMRDPALADENSPFAG